MSLLNANTPIEDNDELLYQYLDNNIKGLLDSYYNNKLKGGWTNVEYKDMVIAGVIALQYIWKSLGKKIPANIKRWLDDKNNVLQYYDNAGNNKNNSNDCPF